MCESGGWGRGTGGKWVGDLGISVTNWNAYSGGSDLSPANQARVAADIEAGGGAARFVPDQNGVCSGW